MTDTTDRSDEVLSNLKTAYDGNREIAYAYAFHYAWALLSEKSRQQLLKVSERKANEAKEND
jgi:hypothetical protein